MVHVYYMCTIYVWYVLEDVHVYIISKTTSTQVQRGASS
jgi:hypothetical protein